MELKEYLKEQIKKVDDKEDNDAILGIYVTDELKFMYHDDCFADFHDDFCILYDKVTETSMVVPYDKIATMQYMTKEVRDKQMEQIGSLDLLKKLLED